LGSEGKWDGVGWRVDDLDCVILGGVGLGWVGLDRKQASWLASDDRKIGAGCDDVVWVVWEGFGEGVEGQGS